MATGKLRGSPGPIFEKFFGGKECFFVQVGSNDGVYGDPLHDAVVKNPQWRGIFIEPLSFLHDRLVRNYGVSDRFTFEQVAIADTAEQRPLYYVPDLVIDELRLPRGFQGVASLDRDHVIKNLIALVPPENAEKHVAVATVNCDTLGAILERHSVGHIDIICIDAEGQDYDVLRQIDFDKYRPKLILYEHYSLSPDDQRAAQALLRRRGYSVVNCNILDSLAVRRG